LADTARAIESFAVVEQSLQPFNTVVYEKYISCKQKAYMTSRNGKSAIMAGWQGILIRGICFSSHLGFKVQAAQLFRKILVHQVVNDSG
jgi:hypothetical protein